MSMQMVNIADGGSGNKYTNLGGAVYKWNYALREINNLKTLLNSSTLAISTSADGFSKIVEALDEVKLDLETAKDEMVTLSAQCDNIKTTVKNGNA